MSVAKKKEAKREFDFKAKDFEFIRKLVYQKTGIVLAEHKEDMVYGRISRRLRKLKMNSFKEYCKLISSPKGESEIVDFVNALTTNLTKFFREEHHFEHLKREVLKPISMNPPVGNRVRMWSAGCSTGMEAYSMAMTACDAISNIDNWDFRILATDIDTNVLEKGQKAIYRNRDISSIPPASRRTYNIKDAKDDIVEMPDKLKRLVAFKHLNFLEETWPVKGSFDVIFCRNVVIYFDKETQKILFNKFAEVMNIGGWLYVGHSENLSSVTDRFALEGQTIYRKIK